MSFEVWDARKRKALRLEKSFHTEYGMKMTLHIDEALLARVIEAYGFSTKTEAIDSALQEMDRRARFKAFVAAPSPFSPEELEAGVEPDYDVLRMRVAEPRGKYGKRK